MTLAENGLASMAIDTGQIYALDAWTGGINWQADMSTMGGGAIYQLPAVDSARVYVVHPDQMLSAGNRDYLRVHRGLRGTAAGRIKQRGHNIALPPRSCNL